MHSGVHKKAWMTALLLAAPLAFSQSRDDSMVKARVALAVARFAEIPRERAPGPLHLCVAVRGKPPAALLGLAQEKVGARGVEVQVGPPFEGCDVIYMHASFIDWRKLLGEKRAPALTVGEMSGFLAAGGMIELVNDSDSVRFDVNLGVLNAQRIRLPAQVLKLARQVRE
jgi:hypothetical protein